MIIYGIKNCNSIKKTLDWCKENQVDFEFHDYKKEGISKEKLQEWTSQVNWEVLVNKKGTTWRKLDDGVKAGVTNTQSAIDLMSENTSLIKRPVVEKDGKVVTVGFDPDILAKAV